jgi:hypothetical protein
MGKIKEFILQNKKRALIIGASVVALAVVIVLTTQYFLSFHKVYIDLADNITAATVYHESSNGEPVNKITSLSQDTTLSLKNGKYLVYTEGDNVDTSSLVGFVVEPDTETVAIQPYLLQEYLDSLLTDKTVSDPKHVSLEEIKEQIKSSPNTSELANIAKGELVIDESWFVGVLITDTTVPSRTKVDQYKVILHNDGDGWYVAADQAFVFRYDSFPDIPREVIKFANEYEI